MLCRLKGYLQFSPQIIINKTSGFGFSMIGSAITWYDLVHHDHYYRLVTTFRIILNPNQAFDFTFEKGSGAPNFNQGRQFSANLTLIF